MAQDLGLWKADVLKRSVPSPVRPEPWVHLNKHTRPGMQNSSRKKRQMGRQMKSVRAHSTSTIEQLTDLRPDVEDALQVSLGNCLTETDLQLGSRTVGKVRDTYDLGDKVVIVTTDRQSAFDKLLATVPFKGQVLNQTSAWWMARTMHIAPNALLAVPDPNAAIMLKCTVFPVEFVVRGFLTGSTETSLWTHYASGTRNYCGNALKDGMRKNDRLEENILTPTTKAADRDVPISPTEIVEQGLMTQREWDEVSQQALALFHFGQTEARQRGLLLVDTKYEFGKASNGAVMLIDEIHTPDSSRYWLADTYEARHERGEEPQSIDKEFLRLWFRQNCDPYHDEVLPDAPRELVTELSRRYITLYERITGQPFLPAPSEEPAGERIARNVKQALSHL